MVWLFPNSIFADIEQLRFMTREAWIMLLIIIEDLKIDPKMLVLMTEQKRERAKEFTLEILKELNRLEKEEQKVEQSEQENK
jgi:hypothetical protein